MANTCNPPQGASSRAGRREAYSRTACEWSEPPPPQFDFAQTNLGAVDGRLFRGTLNHLHQIKDWPERALRTKFAPAALAKDCGVCLRTLERFFVERWGVSPEKWLNEERLRQSPPLLRRERNVKVAAGLLGFKSEFHFSRVFRQHHGYPPSQVWKKPGAESADCRLKA